jgi:hypothetical protein
VSESTGGLLMLHGTSAPISLDEIELYKGEAIRSDYGGQVGVRRYRHTYYALKFSPQRVTAQDGTDSYYYPFWGTQIRRSFTIVGDEPRPGKISIMLPFPDAGKYEIRLRRTSAASTDNSTVDTAVATKITSRGYSLDDNPRAILDLQKQHTLMEIQFEASSNIQGNVQEISALCAQEIRIHDGTRWTHTDTTRNPAWVVADILTGWSIQNHQTPPAPNGSINYDGGWIDDDQIDWDSFVKFAAHCDEPVKYTDRNNAEQERPRYACDLVTNTDDPIIITVQKILSMARAQLILNQSGLLSIMLDEKRDTPRQVLSPRNSWGFKGSRTFTEAPDAFHVKFVAPELNYQYGTTTVYRPGQDARSATSFEEIETFGVTHWHQAELYGRYMMAQGVLRNETFTLNCDVENLVVQRGDMVHIQHDVPLFGGQALIVKDVDFDSAFRVYVDDGLGSFADPVGYTLRQSDGLIAQGSILAMGDDWVELDRFRKVRPEDLLIIGTIKESGSVTDPYLVTAIRPGPDMSAELTLVRYDEAVYDTDYGSAPIWNPSFGGSNPEGVNLEVYDLGGSAAIIAAKDTFVNRVKLAWKVKGDTQHLGGFKIVYFRRTDEAVDIDFVDMNSTSWTGQMNKGEPGFEGGTWEVLPVSRLGFPGQSDRIQLSGSISKAMLLDIDTSDVLDGGSYC